MKQRTVQSTNWATRNGLCKMVSRWRCGVRGIPRPLLAKEPSGLSAFARSLRGAFLLGSLSSPPSWTPPGPPCGSSAPPGPSLGARRLARRSTGHPPSVSREWLLSPSDAWRKKQAVKNRRKGSIALFLTLSAMMCCSYLCVFNLCESYLLRTKLVHRVTVHLAVRIAGQMMQTGHILIGIWGEMIKCYTKEQTNNTREQSVQTSFHTY